MAAVWTLDVSDAGTRHSTSIDKGIWDGEGTSTWAGVSPSLGAGRGLLQLRFSKGTFAQEMHPTDQMNRLTH